MAKVCAVSQLWFAAFHHLPVLKSCTATSTNPTATLSVAAPVNCTAASGLDVVVCVGAVTVGIAGGVVSNCRLRFGSKTWIRSFAVSVT